MDLAKIAIPLIDLADREEGFLKLRPGHVTELLGISGTGLTRLGLRLLAGPSHTASVVALDTRGWISPAAAWETGVVPESLVIVRCVDPGIWPKVAAALLEGVRALYAEVPAGAREQDLRRLAALARARKVAVAMRPMGRGLPSGVAHLRLRALGVTWEGADQGHGRLGRRRLMLEASGKGASGMIRRFEVEDEGSDVVRVVSDVVVGEADAPLDDPVLIVGDRVAAATREVLEAGVSLGMPRREAEALAPFATVLTRDLGEESRRFEPVVESIENLIPRAEVVVPGLVFVPVAGAVRFYGGEDALAERLAKELDGTVGRDRGGQALIGIADGPFAARWAAATSVVGRPLVVTDTIDFLSRLDLTALREGLDADELIDTFRWLGVSTLGDLARLPRDALATRFGNHGLLAHRLAAGEDRFVDPREIPPDLAVDASFEEPLESLDAVAFASRALAERLLRGLRISGVAPHRVSILAEDAAGGARERIWRSADPFTEKALSDRVWWQLRAWVESGGIPGGISRLRIAPADLSDEGRQLRLLQDETSRIEAERALARAQALLGPDGVLQGRVQGGRMPRERVAWSRWGEPPSDRERDDSAPWPGATPSPSPALVPPTPEPLEVEWDGGMPSRVRLGTRWEPVLTWSGPWRLTGRWWVGEEDADRYQLVTSVGAFLCVVTGGQAFLAGVYD